MFDQGNGQRSITFLEEWGEWRNSCPVEITQGCFFEAFCALWHHKAVTQQDPQGLTPVMLPQPVEPVSFTCPLLPKWLLVLSGEGLSADQLLVEAFPCLQG